MDKEISELLFGRMSCTDSKLGKKKRYTWVRSQNSFKKKKKRERVGFQRQISMGALSPQWSGLADVTAPGSLLSLHLSVQEYKFIPQQGRDGLLCGSSASSVDAHRAASPLCWTFCSTLLSWMIWGIIQKVSPPNLKKPNQKNADRWGGLYIFKLLNSLFKYKIKHL